MSVLDEIIHNTREGQEALNQEINEAYKEDEYLNEVQPEQTQEIEVEQEVDGEEIAADTVESDDGDDKPSGNEWAKLRTQNTTLTNRLNELEKQTAEMNGFIKGNQNVNQQFEQQQEQQRLQVEEQSFLESKPDVIDDPDGFAVWMEKKIENKFSKAYDVKIKELQTQNQQYSEQSRIEAGRAELRYIEDEFSKTDTDYKPAKEFLIQSYANELKILHPTATNEQIIQEVRNQELDMAVKAVKDGVSPAQKFKELAKGRGYKATKANGNATKNNQSRSASFVGKSGAAPRGNLKPDEFNGMNMNSLLKNEGQLDSVLGIEGEDYYG